MPSETSSTNPHRGSFRSSLNAPSRRRSSTPKQRPSIKQANQATRSGSSATNNLNSENSAADNLHGLSVLDGFNPQLLAYLNEGDDGNSFAIATSSEDESVNKHEEIDLGDLDEDDIEAEEEAAIRTEIGRRKSLPGPLSLRRLSQSHPETMKECKEDDEVDKNNEVTANSEVDTTKNEDRDERDSSESSSSSWGPDFLDNYFDQPGNVQPLPEPVMNNDPNDDSYLWQYFFSSDEDEATNLNPLIRSKQRRASRSTKQAPASRRGQSPNDQFQGFSPGAPNITTDDSFFVDPNSNNEFLDFGNDGGVTEINIDAGSTDDDVPLKGRGPLPASQLAAMDQRNHVPSGDSTDEDDGVPPERKRKRARGSKAIEVLGANSFSAQPPILGSWRIRGDKNIGIIDGLTTRTLSPPPPPLAYPPSAANSAGNTPQSHSGETPHDPFEGLGDHDFTDFTESPNNNPKRTNEPSPMTSFLGLDDVEINLPETGLNDAAEVSDLDLLELGDFINTENMSSGDDGQVYEFDLMLEPSHDSQPGSERSTKAPVSPYLYRNRMSNRNAPVAAFRNRASPYMNNSGYPVDGFGNPQRRRRSSATRRPSFNKDSYGVNKKRIKKSRSGSMSKGRSGSSGNALYDIGENEHDFIGELVEIGAMSPIYESAER